MGYPTIHPTGVTIYKPEKAWSFYTVFPLENNSSLHIDNNGNEIPKRNQQKS